jgi:hypothetical protein
MSDRCLKSTAAILALVIMPSLLSGCGGMDMSEPREVVISLFGAMEKNDEAALAHLLDIPELMRNSQEDYALQVENVRVFTNPEDILKDLTGEGETKRVWFAHQRIVSNARIMGETATVDVTFVNKAASHGYRTTFGLHLKYGEWRIYSFKTVKE